MSDTYKKVLEQLDEHEARLVIVSKTRPLEAIKEYYDLGHRDFAENRVQALLERKEQLPDDIRWHMIGHLQRNKVKDIMPFIHMIHSVDSLRLAKEINKQARFTERTIPILLQIKIAEEDSKYGFSPAEVIKHLESKIFNELSNLHICGLMAMATFTDNTAQVHQEFALAQKTFVRCQEILVSEDFKELSIGMSGDYKIALEHRATMVRIGSLLF